jgi:nucleoside-diphosphate-sugar epimerase
MSDNGTVMTHLSLPAADKMVRAKRVLVTGATGFTGGHLCRRLAAQGYIVRGLVRNPNRCSPLVRAGVELAVGDLRDAGSLRRAVKDIDVVYHIAGIFRAENVSRRDMWEANVEGTRDLLDAAVDAGVQRFVHCSTAGVHGGITNPPATEETPYSPGDYYQESKTEGERIALQYMAASRLPVVVFRPAGIYGPGDLRFLKLIKAINARRFVMLGSGTVQYQMVFIEDLIDGILLCGTKEGAPGNIYLLTGEPPVTLNQLVKLIAAVLNVPPPRWHFPVGPVYAAGAICELIFKPLRIHPPLYRRRVDFFRKTRAFDISKAKRELGFHPTTELRCGLKTTIEWYRQTGLL